MIFRLFDNFQAVGDFMCHVLLLFSPSPSIVLLLKWGIVKLPGPAGRDPGVDFCVVFYS